MKSQAWTQRYTTEIVDCSCLNTTLRDRDCAVLPGLSLNQPEKYTPDSHIMGNAISLEEELINLRMVSKQMQRSSKKCEKNEKSAVDKLKKVRVIVLNSVVKWDEM